MDEKKLVDSKTGNPLQIGDAIITFRGERGKLEDILYPRHAGSTGRVGITLDNRSGVNYYYPSVINAEWR